jgi:hypothetical protein
MTWLALRSLRARRTSFVACALSIFLAASLMLSFLSLLETAGGKGVSEADQETLITMATVVGAWGIVIVTFSVASTLGITVRRRAEELALLRTIGGTRRQLRRMVGRETLVVAAVSSVAAILPGWALGRLILALLRRAHLVASTVHHRIGVLSVSATIVAMLVASGLAAYLAARRATKGSAMSSLTASATGRGRSGRGRAAFGVFFLLLGATYSTLTVTVMADSSDPFAAMQTAGPACVFWSLGLALFAATLLRRGADVAAVLLGRSRVAGYLALFNARQRSAQLAGALVPVIIFVGMSTGTLYLMAIENSLYRTTTLEGEDTVVLLNYVVVGVISAFAAIMVVNTLVATVMDRRRELATQRVAGVGGRQLTAMIGYEGALIVAVGIVVGGLASLGTVIPYSVVKTDGWLPGNGPGLYLGVCATAIVVTVGTSIVVARRAVAPPVMEAIGRA